MLERLTGPRALRVVGRGRGALHLDLDGFVVTLSGPGVPRMANAIAVPVVRAPMGVGWDAARPPAWSPFLAPLPGGRAEVAALARRLAARVGDGALGDPWTAADRLLGRGPGLTPEGDDVLAGAALAVRALGPAAGLDEGDRAALIDALCPEDARLGTGSLSATLLELAARGGAPEPVHRLLAGRDREAALADLLRLGGTTGGAIAAGIAAAARYLLDTTGPILGPR